MSPLEWWGFGERSGPPRGGAVVVSHPVLRTYRWQQLRKAIVATARANGTPWGLCGVRLGPGDRIDVDHVVPSPSPRTWRWSVGSAARPRVLQPVGRGDGREPSAWRPTVAVEGPVRAASRHRVSGSRAVSGVIPCRTSKQRRVTYTHRPSAGTEGCVTSMHRRHHRDQAASPSVRPWRSTRSGPSGNGSGPRAPLTWAGAGRRFEPMGRSGGRPWVPLRRRRGTGGRPCRTIRFAMPDDSRSCW